MEITSIRKQVAEFLDAKENPVPRDLAVNMVLQFLRDHLISGGKPWTADGMAVLLMPDGTLKNLTLDNQEILDFIHAAGLPLNSAWKNQVGDTLPRGTCLRPPCAVSLTMTGCATAFTSMSGTGTSCALTAAER